MTYPSQNLSSQTAEHWRFHYNLQTNKCVINNKIQFNKKHAKNDIIIKPPKTMRRPLKSLQFPSKLWNSIDGVVSWYFDTILHQTYDINYFNDKYYLFPEKKLQNCQFENQRYFLILMARPEVQMTHACDFRSTLKKSLIYCCLKWICLRLSKKNWTIEKNIAKT